ncbi:MAG TPA: methyltransferase domain-containing protein [Tepidisphaeraceae bacterium]|nr:methyltransferase domain-containing protein [Tepidisphaeraceae bacterium]
MQEASTKRIYDWQSKVYESTFGFLVRRRVQTAVNHLAIRPNDLVLDLGIGTGASLNYFPTDRGRIIGIDLSKGMLNYCQQKINERGLKNVRIFQANALQLPFADDVFDQVFISHVISVVSDPAALVREAQRVAKPGARILILNHFQSSNRVIAKFEKWTCPFWEHLGWRSDLALQDVIRATNMQIDYRFKLGNIDLWETVVTTNDKSALKACPA